VKEEKRTSIPAVTHVDNSARIQTVSKKTNPYFWELLHQFKLLTGESVVLNTSFNVKGEPIVCTPEEAVRCFLKTDMDYLVMGPFVCRRIEGL
jgi:carbamoyltransferase